MEKRLIFVCGKCGLEMILEEDGASATLPWHTQQRGGEYPKTVCPAVGSTLYTLARPKRLAQPVESHNERDIFDDWKREG
jgi:hypothetical protein